ncbi:MAG: LapA family protein [Bacteroidales bacterium]
MLKRYILILITTVLVVIFAVQNVGMADIKLWFFDTSASLSLIIILTFVLGALVTLLFAFQEIRKRNKKIGDLEDKIKVFKLKNATEKTKPTEFTEPKT